MANPSPAPLPDVRLRTPNRVKQGVAGVGDMNGDGRDDLVVMSFDADASELLVVIYH